MENAIDLTPDMLLGLPIDQAQAAATAAGRVVRIHPAGAGIPQEDTPDCFTLTVSSSGTVLEAWDGLDGPSGWARVHTLPERAWPEPYFSTARDASRW